MVKLSIVIPFRDRAYERVQCCLYSLSQQTVMNFDIIISDYGSKTVNLSKIPQEFFNRQISIVKTATTDVWSRSRALNLGCKLSKAEYLMCTDVDIIFQPDFIEMITNNLKPEFLLTHKMISETLPSIQVAEIKNALYNNEFWSKEACKKYYPANKYSGGGACHVIHRKHFFDIGGYDEFYKVWGAEDSDLEYRLIKMMKLKHRDLSSSRFIHLWHDASSRGKRNPTEHAYVTANTLHYQKTTKNLLPLVRNDGPWEL